MVLLLQFSANKSWAFRCRYRLAHLVTRVLARVFLRAKVEGRENVPAAGGGLVCANHQSYLDPILIGMAFDRSMCYVARETLFRWPILSHLMRWYDAIPIRREGIGLSGLKEVLRRTKADELVLMFPEGTRSHDGQVGDFLAGFSVVAKRARVPIIPVGIDGAFHVWPRHRWFPWPARIAITIGDPITSESAAEMTDDAFVAAVSRRVTDCHARARELRSR